LISKKTASFNRKTSTTISYQSAAPVDPEKIKDLIVVPIETQLSSHQYKAKEQFIKLDRELLKKIPLSGVYEDTSINNSIILLDEFRDAVNDLFLSDYITPAPTLVMNMVLIFSTMRQYFRASNLSVDMMILNLESIPNAPLHI